MSDERKRDLEAKLLKVLYDHGRKVKLSALPQVWTEQYGNVLNSTAFGYPSLSSLCQNLGDNIKLVRERTGTTLTDFVRIAFDARVVGGHVERVRRQLAKEKRTVSSGSVVHKVCQSLGVPQYEELGLGKPHQLPAIKTIMDLEKRIETYITVHRSVRHRGISTLYELERLICQEEKVKSFDDLNMGPLLEHPFVKKDFNPAVGLTSIPQVSHQDVVDAVFSARRRTPHGQRLTADDILSVLKTSKDVADERELCVYIGDVGFYMTVSGHVHCAEKNHIREWESARKKMLSDEQAERMKSLQQFEEEKSQRLAAFKASCQADTQKMIQRLLQQVKADEQQRLMKVAEGIAKKEEREVEQEAQEQQRESHDGYLQHLSEVPTTQELQLMWIPEHLLPAGSPVLPVTLQDPSHLREAVLWAMRPCLTFTDWNKSPPPRPGQGPSPEWIQNFGKKGPQQRTLVNTAFLRDAHYVLSHSRHQDLPESKVCAHLKRGTELLLWKYVGSIAPPTVDPAQVVRFWMEDLCACLLMDILIIMTSDHIRKKIAAALDDAAAIPDLTFLKLKGSLVGALFLQVPFNLPRRQLFLSPLQPKRFAHGTSYLDLLACLLFDVCAALNWTSVNASLGAATSLNHASTSSAASESNLAMEGSSILDVAKDVQEVLRVGVEFKKKNHYRSKQLVWMAALLELYGVPLCFSLEPLALQLLSAAVMGATCLLPDMFQLSDGLVQHQRYLKKYGGGLPYSTMETGLSEGRHSIVESLECDGDDPGTGAARDRITTQGDEGHEGGVRDSGPAHAPRGPRVIVSLRELAEVIAEKNQGGSFASLAALEQELLEEFDVNSFDQLGHGGSLVQLLSQHADIADLVTGGLQGGVLGQVVEEEVMRIVRAAQQACKHCYLGAEGTSKHREVISECACLHFGVISFEHLGHGRLEHLLDRLGNGTDGVSGPIGPGGADGEDAWSLGVAAALTISGSGESLGAESPVESSLTAQQLHTLAAQLITSAPILEDLMLHCSWQSVFQPVLGPLVHFIEHSKPRLEVAALQLPSGAVLKLPASMERQHLFRALSQMDPKAVTACLLSMAVERGSPMALPLALLGTDVLAGLQGIAACAANSSVMESCTPQEGFSSAACLELCTFILKCLAFFPPLLRATPLCTRVLLGPLTTLLGSPSLMHSMMLEAAGRNATWLLMLHQLGSRLGVVTWQDQALSQLADRVQTTASGNLKVKRAADMEPLDKEAATGMNEDGVAAPSQHTAKRAKSDTENLMKTEPLAHPESSNKDENKPTSETALVTEKTSQEVRYDTEILHPAPIECSELRHEGERSSKIDVGEESKDIGTALETRNTAETAHHDLMIGQTVLDGGNHGTKVADISGQDLMTGQLVQDGGNDGARVADVSDTPIGTTASHWGEPTEMNTSTIAQHLTPSGQDETQPESNQSPEVEVVAGGLAVETSPVVTRMQTAEDMEAQASTGTTSNAGGDGTPQLVTSSASSAFGVKDSVEVAVDDKEYITGIASAAGIKQAAILTVGHDGRAAGVGGEGEAETANIEFEGPLVATVRDTAGAGGEGEAGTADTESERPFVASVRDTAEAQVESEVAEVEDAVEAKVADAEVGIAHSAGDAAEPKVEAEGAEIEDEVKAEVDAAVAIANSAGDFVEAKVEAEAVAAGSGRDAAGAQAASVEPEDPCQVLVNGIRRKFRGLDMHVDGMDERQKEVLQQQNELIGIIGRSLQRLSNDLYSKDMHFVLELVQNADDNSYVHGVAPSVEFILHEDRIEVLNNETGFTPQNLRSLCDVGNSSKKRTSGYIGQKGIGFKSVFRVSDRPEVHSNGFHVAFDVLQHKSLGYILPTWVGPADYPLSSCTEFGPDSATRIVLPLTSALRGEAGDGLRRKFSDLHHTLLMFLQKLTCLAITDRVNGHHTVMKRRDLANGIMELMHGPNGEKSNKWLVASHKITPALPRLDVKVDETVVSIGFTLDGKRPTQQEVFAFLPLRSYGLRFLLQGDWVVPSSREAVDSDNPWNQMLRGHVPDLFAGALAEFLKLEVPESQSHNLYYWIDWWLSCIPLEGEAQGFFRGLPQMIAARLRLLPCIPTEDGDMVPPSQAMVCWNPTLRKLMSHPLLRGQLGLRFAHEGVQILHTSPKLRHLLGVCEYTPSQLLDLCQSLCQNQLLPQLGASWVGQLLCCIFQQLSPNLTARSQYNSAKSAAGQGVPPNPGTTITPALRSQIIQSLSVLPLIPMPDGSFIAATGGAVFGLPARTSSSSIGGNRTRRDSDATPVEPPPVDGPMSLGQTTNTRLSPPNTSSLGSIHTPIMFPFTTILQGSAESAREGASSRVPGGPRSAQFRVADRGYVGRQAAGRDAGSKSTGAQKEVVLNGMVTEYLKKCGMDVGQCGKKLRCFDATLLVPPSQGKAGEEGVEEDNTFDAAVLVKGLRDLGVRDVEALDVTQHVITPFFTSDECLRPEAKSRVGSYTAFLLTAGLVPSPQQKNQRMAKECAEVLQHLCVVTNTGTIRVLPTTPQDANTSSSEQSNAATSSADQQPGSRSPPKLYMPPEFGNRIDLCKVLPAGCWCVISAAEYAKFRHLDPGMWGGFFRKYAGGEDFLTVRKVVSPADQAASHIREALQGSEVPDGTQIEDWVMDGFEALVQAIHASRSSSRPTIQQIKFLATAFNKLWRTSYEDKLTARVIPPPSTHTASHASGSDMATRVQDHPNDGPAEEDNCDNGDNGGNGDNSRGGGDLHGGFCEDSQWEDNGDWGAMSSPRKENGGYQARVVIPSSFKLGLESQAWLPSSKGTGMRPSELFWSGNRELKVMFGDQVPYLEGEYPAGMLQELGVVQDLDLDAVLAVLRDWIRKYMQKTEGAEQLPSRQCEFSLGQMTTIYEFLSRHMEESDEAFAAVSQLFYELPAVWIPEKALNQDDVQQNPWETGHSRKQNWSEATMGRFYPMPLLRFQDPTRLMEGVEECTEFPIRVVAMYYTNRDFFVSQLRPPSAYYSPEGMVRNFPLPKDYCNLLEVMVKSKTLSRQEKLAGVVTVFSMWSSGVEKGALKPDEIISLRKMLTPLKVFPTSRNVWVSLSDRFFIDDDTTLSRQFADEEDVHFLQVTIAEQARKKNANRGCNYPTKIIHFLQAMQVPLLSQSVRRFNLNYGFYPATQIAEVVHKTLGYAQRCLYSICEKEEYEKIEQSLGSKLKDFRCYVVTELEVVYELINSKKDITSTKRVPIPALLDEHSHLYVQDINNHYDICIELTRLFALTQPEVAEQLSECLFNVMLQIESGRADAEDTMQRKGYPALPAEVEVWEVKQVEVVTEIITQPVEEKAEDVALDDEPSTSKPPPKTRPSQPFKAMYDPSGGASVNTGTFVVKPRQDAPAPPPPSTPLPQGLTLQYDVVPISQALTFTTTPTAPTTALPVTTAAVRNDAARPHDATPSDTPTTGHTTTNTPAASQPAAVAECTPPTQHIKLTAAVDGKAGGNAADNEGAKGGHPQSVSEGGQPGGTTVPTVPDAVTTPADQAGSAPDGGTNVSGTTCTASEAPTPTTLDDTGMQDLSAQVPDTAAGTSLTSGDVGHDTVGVELGGAVGVQPGGEGAEGRVFLSHSDIEVDIDPELVRAGVALQVEKARSSLRSVARGAGFTPDIFPRFAAATSPVGSPSGGKPAGVPSASVQLASQNSLRNRTDNNDWPHVTHLESTNNVSHHTRHDAHSQGLADGGMQGARERAGDGSMQGGRERAGAGSFAASRSFSIGSSTVFTGSHGFSATPGRAKGWTSSMVPVQLASGRMQELVCSSTLIAKMNLPESEDLLAADDNATQQHMTDVGVWGEKLVHLYLQDHPQFRDGGAGTWKVKWMNELSESGEPYDFRLTGPDGEEVFVEVKSTSSRGKDVFELSHHELLFAQRHGDNYHIYRVYGAGTKNPVLARAINIMELWLHKQVKVCVVLPSQLLCEGVMRPMTHLNAALVWDPTARF